MNLINTEKSKLEFRNFENKELIDLCVDEIKGLLNIKPAIHIYGKVVHQQRNVGFFSDTSIGYQYSGQLSRSKPLTKSLKILLDEVNKLYKAEFNGILVNEYLSGEDYISAHSDDERNLDKVGVVCISVGAERKFRIREKVSKNIVLDLLTTSYGVYFMSGDFQKEFTHEIPIEKKVKGSRISFTFRKHLE